MCGLRVWPRRAEEDSKERSVVGTEVLTKGRAPASRTTRASAVPAAVAVGGEAEPRRSPRVTKTAARR